MTMTTRNPTMVAECGCPYDPDYDEGSLGWHLIENHPPMFTPLRTPFGFIRQPTAEECELVGRHTVYSEPCDDGDLHDDYRELGDYVIANVGNVPGMEALRDACLELAICDDAHIIPAGIYVEE